LSCCFCQCSCCTCCVRRTLNQHQLSGNINLHQLQKSINNAENLLSATDTYTHIQKEREREAVGPQRQSDGHSVRQRAGSVHLASAPCWLFFFRVVLVQLQRHKHIRTKRVFCFDRCGNATVILPGFGSPSDCLLERRKMPLRVMLLLSLRKKAVELYTESGMQIMRDTRERAQM